jgi:hypothetical protein
MANGILNMARGLGHITGPGPDRAGLHPSTTAREPPPRRRGQRDDADVIKKLRRARLGLTNGATDVKARHPCIWPATRPEPGSCSRHPDRLPALAAVHAPAG